MKKTIEEFKSFATRGNVIDLAVGIIIGGAFGKIVSSFVSDVLMPPIGLILGGVNFSGLSIELKEGVSLNYGNFIQTVVDFLIIAFSIFWLVKFANKIKNTESETIKKIDKQDQQIDVLREIRDILKKNN